MRDYHLHQLTGEDFERVVIHICYEVLGKATVNFSEGRDGGRDGKFEGTANAYPSKAAPWSGKFIIQAKRVANPMESCAESRFKTKVLATEIPKLKKLKASGECDVYLLFTNRKLPGGAHQKLCDHISTGTGVKKVGLLGVETITEHLNSCPHVVRACGLEKFRGPLRIQPDELKEIITKFHEHRKSFASSDSTKYSFDYTELETKNEINRLRSDYFNYMQEQSHSSFETIKDFLTNPVNRDLQDMYYTVVDELQGKIITHRDNFDYFDEIFGYLYDHILEIAPELKPKRRLINTFLHFMYCSCDIGKRK